MSSDKSEEDEHEVISKQIIDYYKKYSQSKQLPKYLSGSSLSYMPRIVKEEEIGGNSGSAVIVTSTENTLEKEESVEPKISPTSSVTSNRKLEWDNGADIGYNNCVTKLHKSLSLPILFNTKSVDKTNISKLSREIVTVISYPTNSDKSISSSSSSSRAEVPIESSSSFKTNSKPISVGSSSSTNISVFLKNKIGSPEAESTPKVLSLPKVKVNSKNVYLCITKPIIVECFGYQKKEGSDKKIQTSFVKVLSRSIQTDTGLPNQPPNLTFLQKNQKNQSIIFVNHDSDTEKQTSSSNIQVDTGMIASQCDSFEYYKDEIQQKLNIDSNSSKESPLLGLFMTQKQSKSLIGDVDRSIELLQKLLKSKKYDPATKKHYIKKIVEKIVNNKYSEDSTTSSELFIPRKQNDDKIRPTFKKNVPFSSNFTVKTFNEQFLPSATTSESKKRSIFTISHENRSDTVTSCEKQPVMSSESCPSWKEDKTTSEKLLEQKQKGQGDQLVQFAKKEREHQITWITDEICHLTKLKGLLEKRKQRTATVYMVSHHFDQYPKSGSHPISRNYVTEQEVSSTSSGNVPVGYTFNDEPENKIYTMEEVSARPEININRKVVDNIEVVSDDKTADIKVKTKKLDFHNAEGFKPKPPALVGIGKYETFPRSKTEERTCWPCGRATQKVDGLCNKRHYSFEVPLNHRTSFVDKINDIINKYTTGSSTDKFSHCCKCTEILKINDNISSGWSCHCKGKQHVGAEKCVCRATQDTRKRICSICGECKINKPKTDTSNKKSTKSCSHKCKICEGCTVEPEPYEQRCHCLKPEKHDNKLQKANAEVQSKLCKCCKCRGRKDQSDTSENSCVKSYNGRCKIYEDGEHNKQTCDCCTFENTNDSNLQKENAKYPTVLNKYEKIKPLRECKCKDQKDSDESVKNSFKSCNCKLYEGNGTEMGLNKQRCRCCECKNTLDLKLQKETTGSQTDDSKFHKEIQVDSSICNCGNCQRTEEKDSYGKEAPGSYLQKEESGIQTEKETKESKCTQICCKCENSDKINDENKPTTYVQTLDKEKSTKSEENSDHSNSQSSFSSSSATDFGSQTDTLKSCLCCKQKNVTSQLLYRLKNKLCDEAYPLCRPCYRQNRMGVYTLNCYRNPTHICNCYTIVQTQTLEAIKGTINDLRELEEYCTCINANNGTNSDYCKHCKCKLKKASKNKNGIAYMLTIENGPYDEDIKKNKSAQPYLEEIKIKIPHKKKHKDKENHRKKKNAYDDEETGTVGATFQVYSLQEHLSKNRPDFITKAEGRRNVVKQSRTQREEMSDCNKLQFLKQLQEKNEKLPDLKRLFSVKEMKEITRRNYKKLPEVQRKLINNRDKQLRQATRLMVATFNRKLRQNVLKGKKSIPTNVNVTDM